ncbi:hypothetical protein OIY81_1278 [Cryptosporidium canis]|uniref:t-SNARE coiled-coil homology domain-containing protein n=1 Tax=Cryptosporidium canis TaxID=195482 RepID=A0ABQ8P9H5_9CRYT|nr:hypothetical protein OJ252_1945 [Cryptosporidium canis]KAJ1612468.1 hypothetical protein OIY81_1278 [Cryptosporidium canis]
MYRKDPYYKAFSELEQISEGLIQKCYEFKEKAENILDYSKNSEIRNLYEKINVEIERFDEMYTVLDNIINNLKKNPNRFIEISKDELNNREKNLKSKNEIVVYCKDQARRTYNNALEREVQNQRKINRDYLINSYASMDNHTMDHGFYNTESSINNENLEYINQNTKKLHNAALIISHELNEQNNLIEGMVFEVENESEFRI